MFYESRKTTKLSSIISLASLPTRPPSTMFVTMTMTQTPWSQTVRQKSPKVLATGPEIHEWHVNDNSLCRHFLSIPEMHDNKTSRVHNINSFVL